MMAYSNEAISLYSYMQELHRAAILATKYGSVERVIAIRKTLARVSERYRQINTSV